MAFDWGNPHWNSLDDFRRLADDPPTDPEKVVTLIREILRLRAELGEVVLKVSRDSLEKNPPPWHRKSRGGQL